MLAGEGQPGTSPRISWHVCRGICSKVGLESPWSMCDPPPKVMEKKRAEISGDHQARVKPTVVGVINATLTKPVEALQQIPGTSRVSPGPH